MSLRRREIEALGLRTRVLEAGDPDAEEAVVMLHGAPGSAETWDDLLPRVGDFARAVSLDLPGFGAAVPAPGYVHTPAANALFVGAALDVLGVRRAHLVMSDIGGDGLLWGAAHSDAFASAVLVATGTFIGYRWHFVAQMHRAPFLGAVMPYVMPLGMAAGLRVLEPGLSRDARRRLNREYALPARRAMLGLYRAIPPASFGRLAPVLRRLDRPALVVWGERDRFVGPEQAERQRASFPRAEVVVLEGRGHYCHLEDPETVAGLVVPFLREQVGA